MVNDEYQLFQVINFNISFTLNEKSVFLTLAEIMNLSENKFCIKLTIYFIHRFYHLIDFKMFLSKLPFMLFYLKDKQWITIVADKSVA